MTTEHDATWKKRYDESLATLLEVAIILTKDRDGPDCHATAIAFMAAGERILRIIFNDPDVKTAETYYRIADAAALMCAAPEPKSTTDKQNDAPSPT